MHKPILQKSCLKSQDLQAPLYLPLKPINTGCVCLSALQGTLPKTKNIKKSWDFFLLGYKKQIPKHSPPDQHKTNWETVKLSTNVWLEAILSLWEQISKKKNLGQLWLKAQPKTLTTASSEVSTEAQKGSKQTAAQHSLNTSFTYPSQGKRAEEWKEMLCKQLGLQFWGEILIAQK